MAPSLGSFSLGGHSRSACAVPNTVLPRFFPSIRAVVVPLAYVIFWAKGSFGIESSMQANPLDRKAQNGWNFGQAILFSLSSVKR